jgi:prepilin peptidase CpaA
MNSLALFSTMTPDKAWVVIMLCVAMIVMAVVDFRYLKIHNILTFPVIFAGWAYSFFAGWAQGASSGPYELYLPLRWLGLGNPVLFDVPGGLGGAIEGLWASLALSFLGLGLLIMLYAIGGVGAGDVKMQMGFGAWVAPIYGLEEGASIIWWGFAFGAIAGGVISVIMIWWNGTYKQNLKNAGDILTDMLRAKGNIPEIHDKAMARKPTLQLLPYGVPLCIGYLAYVAWDWYTTLAGS